MKSRTSSFKTILRKDILRFAPLWALYLIGWILILFSGAGYTTDSTVRNLMGEMSLYSVINLIYAALAAQLLFGDLFNSRMCNALHAMPMRRETWFLSHVLSGLCFSLVPNLIVTLAMLPMLGNYWYISFVWLLGMTLDYLCFFGLAVFSVFCTGNRFAMVAVYGVLNFFALIVLWFVTTIYQPLLYGFVVTEETFHTFSPFLKMVNTRWIEIDGGYDRATGRYVIEGVYMTQEWWYLAAYAAVGAVLLGAGLLLYRRRKLESAGNFMAVKPLAPVFSVIFALFVGALFAMFGYNGNGTEDYLHLIFLSVGLVVGYFAGQMLLQRTVKVFKPMAFVKLAVLVAAMFASIGLTIWDPLGVEEWVPEADAVQSVTLSGTATIWDDRDGLIEIKDQEMIEKIIELHEMALRNGEYDGPIPRNDYVNIRITYTMKDGRTVRRLYSTYYNGTRDEYRELISGYQKIVEAVQ